MTLKRRAFINMTTAAVATGLVAPLTSCDNGSADQKKEPGDVKDMTADVQPITVQERNTRIEKAQKLLQQSKLDALVLDCGTSLSYFTGVNWWPSERTMAVILPANGELRYVCPAFEEGRLRESLLIGDKVYVWQEDESPFKQIVSAVKDAGVRSGKVVMERELRFFILDGVRKEAPAWEYLPDPVTPQCRLAKSPAEIALMQKATEITLLAIKAGIDSLKEGITADDVASVVAKTHSQLGAVNAFADVNFAKATASPHGSRLVQELKRGDVVLLDCGCLVHGYSSDVTRSIVFGAEPTSRQSDIWSLEKKAQAAGFAAARLGATCESVDAAARKVITDAGFGPGYQLPGLPHRTGHGIGMDTHEWGYIVKGNKQLLEPGMCFSIEPTISIPGEFGIRLEDCVHMTEEGPQWFSQPSPSIDRPFA